MVKSGFIGYHEAPKADIISFVVKFIQDLNELVYLIEKEYRSKGLSRDLIHVDKKTKKLKN